MRLNSSSARHVSRTASAAADGAVGDVGRDVLAEILEPIGVHGRGLGAGRDDDEIAVPRLERLEPREQLVALGASVRAADALVRLARREVERVDERLLALARLLASLGRRRRAGRRPRRAGSNAGSR